MTATNITKIRVWAPYKQQIVEVIVDSDFADQFDDLASLTTVPDRYGPIWRLNMRAAKYRATGRTIPRYIMRPSKNDVVLHKNGDHLDCRRENLEVVSRSIFSADRRIHREKNKNSESYSPYRGVSKLGEGRYQATHASQKLGTFFTDIAAAKAYDKAVRDHYGDRAITNFPEEEKNGG